MQFQLCLKAIFGAVAAGLGALTTILAGTATFSQVTDAQWVTVAVTFIGTFWAIWGVPNATPKPAPAVFVAPPPVVPPAA
jgi:hypothetical protein